MYARQAISTRYLGPTDTRGSRVKAVCAAGSLTIGWDDALNPLDNHAAAARALATKLGWSGGWHAGWVHGGGYVFVQPTDDSAFTVVKPA